MRRLLCLMGCVLLLASCKEDELTYPSIIHELANLHTNDQGVMYQMETDSMVTYVLANPQTGYQANKTIRALCGYVRQGQDEVILYQAEPCLLLDDSTSNLKQDPTGVVSAWMTDTYINLHLKPRASSTTSYWGYAIERTGNHRLWVRIHHHQPQEPLSYSQQMYTSIPLKSLPQIQVGDTITLSINTFEGTKIWNFIK